MARRSRCGRCLQSLCGVSGSGTRSERGGSLRLRRTDSAAPADRRCKTPCTPTRTLNPNCTSSPETHSADLASPRTMKLYRARGHPKRPASNARSRHRTRRRHARRYRRRHPRRRRQAPTLLDPTRCKSTLERASSQRSGASKRFWPSSSDCPQRVHSQTLPRASARLTTSGDRDRTTLDTLAFPNTCRRYFSARCSDAETAAVKAARRRTSDHGPLRFLRARSGSRHQQSELGEAL